jgi:dephospho-CoA kinase
MDRPAMTAAKLDTLLQRQLPDSEKRHRADFIVDTSRGFDSARAQVRAILEAVPAIRPKAIRPRHA